MLCSLPRFNCIPHVWTWQVDRSHFEEVKNGHGAHHHHLDDHMHFEPGILSIHKYKGTCYHAFFKVRTTHTSLLQ